MAELQESSEQLSENERPQPGDQILEEHVHRILDSPQFARAETQRKLLLYLWSHRNEELNEYAVATDALGRRSDFDPKLDASVRVQISRLRRKLKEYYEAAPPEEPQYLAIPMGTHSLVVQEGTPAAQEPAEPATDEPLPSPSAVESRGLTVSLAVLVCIFALLTVWLLWQRHATEEALDRANALPSPFWSRFLDKNVDLKILLPTPTFFSFPKMQQLHVRDLNVNDYSDWQKSLVLQSLARQGGVPTLDHSYTVTSDTLAALNLARYLDRVNLGDRVTFVVSDESNMGLLEHSDVVALGAHSTLHPFRDYLSVLNFSMGPQEAWVDNAHPEKGEPPRFVAIQEGTGRLIAPSILAVLPGRGPHTKLLLLQSRYTSALIDLLTSRVGSELFERMYRAHGSPPYFEMVIDSEIENQHNLRTWPVAMHAYTKGIPSISALASQ